MNLAILYLTILTFGLYPRLVRAYDIRGLTLFDPTATTSSFLDDWFEDPSETFSAIMKRQEQAFERAFSSLRGASFGLPYPTSGKNELSSSSPKYEIFNDNEQFAVLVNLPASVQPNDVNIQFDEKNRMLTISGRQETKNDETGYLFSSSFSRSFQLDPFVRVEQLVATLEGEGSNLLKVSAPKDVDRLEHAVRSIPLTTIPPVALEDGVAANEETEGTDDPFHVKKRVEKARQHYQQQQEEQNEEGELPENPIDRLMVDPENLKDPAAELGYKTSELRRRR